MKIIPQLHRSLSMALATATAVVFGSAYVARAENTHTQVEGRVFRIGSDDGQTIVTTTTSLEGGGDATAETSDKPDAPAEKMTHWIGIYGGPVTPELRAHLDIPAGQGLLVRNIVPDSPAAKAGLKEYDILLRGNESDLKDMHDLMELVRTVGPQKGQITLEVLRQGKRESVIITPAERPANVAHANPPVGEGGGMGWGGQGRGHMQPGGENNMMQFFGQLDQGGDGGGGQAPANQGWFRMMGPGIVMGQAFDLSQMPNGVSFNIQKQNDQPTHITVTRGDEKWEIASNDLDSLNQLPPELRPFFAKLLNAVQPAGPMAGVGGMPAMPRMPRMQSMPRMGGHDMEQRLQERLDQMEQHLKELEERMHNSNMPNPPATPDNAK